MSKNNDIKVTEDKPKKRFRFFNKIAMFITHIAALFIFLSYLAAYVSPESFWFIAFLGLAYPIILCINIAMLIYWLIQLKKIFLYPLIFIIIGWSNLTATIQINFSDPSFDKTKAIKVLSYNVKVFDLYNWSHNEETGNKMFNFFKKEDADIMCFQEFFSRDTIKFNNMDSLLKFTKTKNVHVKYSINDKYKQHFGIATFTKYPIVNKGEIKFKTKNNNLCIYTDVLINTDTVRIYNMHLQSIAFSESDYKYAEDLKNNVDAEDIKNSKNILRRLKRAFLKRAKQADLIHESISKCKYPVIVCGDFNDTPSSYAYNTIRKSLKDAFIESGSGTGQSYVGSFPSFRIDYILHSPKFNSYQFTTIKQELSDHYPITTYLVKE